MNVHIIYERFLSGHHVAGEPERFSKEVLGVYSSAKKRDEAFTRLQRDLEGDGATLKITMKIGYGTLYQYYDGETHLVSYQFETHNVQ